MKSGIKIMLKKITLVIPTILFATASYAGGPDSIGGLDDHWAMSIQTGATINIANSESFYQNSTANTSQSFQTTGYDVAGLAGAELAYHWNLSHFNQFGIAASANYDFGGAKVEDIWHIDTNVATSDPMDLKNTVQPKWIYNFLLTFMHNVSNNLLIGIHGGFSLLQEKTTLTVTDVGSVTAGNQAAAGSHANTAYTPGAALGLQASLLVTPNSSMDFSINDYIYKGKSLPTIESIDTGANDQLTRRKAYVSIPSFLIKYTYHF